LTVRYHINYEKQVFLHDTLAYSAGILVYHAGTSGISYWYFGILLKIIAKKLFLCYSYNA